MIYDDEARRFNFVSGLVCGAVLGAGLAMLVGPQKRLPARLKRTTRSLAGRAAGGLEGVRGMVRDTVEDALHAGRQRLGM